MQEPNPKKEQETPLPDSTVQPAPAPAATDESTTTHPDGTDENGDYSIVASGLGIDE